MQGKLLYDNIINFDNTLDLKYKYLCRWSTKYELYAVNECIGKSSNSGHYYSYIKIKDCWYNFNDNSVTKRTPSFNSEYVVGLYYIKKK